MAIERITPSNHAEWRQHGLHHLQRYEFAGSFVRGRTVLDLACGNGYGSFALMNCGAKSVEGVDLDPSAIAYAKQHYRRDSLSFNCRNAFDQPSVAGGYEAIVCFETIEHLEKPVEFIGKLRGLLRNDGTLIISTPNTLQYKRGEIPIDNPFHLSEPTYEEFRSWVERGFVIEQEWEQSPVVINFHEQSERLKYAGFVRILLAVEAKVKSWLGSPSLRMATQMTRQSASYCELSTRIFPLLPERRALANVFIFVCRPAASTA